jgi:RNA polymerase sigma-70 factor (ECF subfamily)
VLIWTSASDGARYLRGKKFAPPDADSLMHVASNAEPLPIAVPAGGVARRAYAPVRMSGALGDAVRPDRQESYDWVAALGGEGAAREEALARLHDLLLRGAHFELRRRHEAVRGLSHGALEDLALQATSDAMVAILAKLDTFRGESRFTTWAYKFVLLEAGVKLRRRAWQGREVNLDDEAWPAIADTGPSAQQTLEDSELFGAIRAAIDSELTPHQREVFIALALNGVPIDVLSERLGTTRGALYKTLHDARRKLRAALAEAGLGIGDDITGRTA